MEKNLTAKTWQIDTIDELKAFRNEVNAGNSFAGWTVTLGNDIDLEGVEWAPIGDATNNFKGTFNGNDKTISNLVVDTEGGAYAGFFGFLDAAVVKNLTFENVNITGGNYTGTVAGYTNAEYGICQISGVTVKGTVTVTGSAAVGGIIGGGDAALNNVTVNAAEGSLITGTSGDVGGIAGIVKNDGKTYEEGSQFSDISSNINVKGEGDGVNSVGGVFGVVEEGITIEGVKCSAGSVTADGVGEDSKDSVGGIAGIYGADVTFNDADITVGAVTGSYFDNNGDGHNNNASVGDNYFVGTGEGIVTVNARSVLTVDETGARLANIDLNAAGLEIAESADLSIGENASVIFETSQINGTFNAEGVKTVDLGNITLNGTLNLNAESYVKGGTLDLADDAVINLDASSYVSGVRVVLDLSNDESLKGRVTITTESAEDVKVFYAADGDVAIGDFSAKDFYVSAAYKNKNFAEVVDETHAVGLNAFATVDEAVAHLYPETATITVAERESSTLSTSVTTENPDGLVIDMGNHGTRFNKMGNIVDGEGNAAEIMSYIDVNREITIGEGVTVIADFIGAFNPSKSLTIDGTVRVNDIFNQCEDITVNGELACAEDGVISMLGGEGTLAVNGTLTAGELWYEDGCSNGLLKIGADGNVSLNTLTYTCDNAADLEGLLTVSGDASFSALDLAGTLNISAAETLTLGNLTGAGKINIAVDGYTGGTRQVIDFTGDKSGFTGEIAFDSAELPEGVTLITREDGDYYLTDGDLTAYVVSEKYAGEYGAVMGDAADKRYFGINAFADLASALEANSAILNEITVAEGEKAVLKTSVTTENPNGLVIDMGNNGVGMNKGGQIVDLATGTTAGVYSELLYNNGSFEIGENVTVKADIMRYVFAESLKIAGNVEVNGFYADDIDNIVISGTLAVESSMVFSTTLEEGLEVSGTLTADTLVSEYTSVALNVTGKGKVEVDEVQIGIVTVAEDATLTVNEKADVVSMDIAGSVNLTAGAVVKVDTLTGAGTLNLTCDDTLTLGTMTGEGTIVIDAATYESGICKVIDVTGGTIIKDRVKIINLGENFYQHYAADGDVYLIDQDQKTIYVDSVNAEGVVANNTAAEGKALEGYNKFDTLLAASEAGVLVDGVTVDYGNAQRIYTASAMTTNGRTYFREAGTYTITGGEGAYLPYVALNGPDVVVNIEDAHLTMVQVSFNGSDTVSSENAQINITNTQLDAANGDGAGLAWLTAYGDTAMTITNSVVGLSDSFNGSIGDIAVGNAAASDVTDYLSSNNWYGRAYVHITGSLDMVDSTLFAAYGFNAVEGGAITLDDSVVYTSRIELGGNSTITVTNGSSLRQAMWGNTTYRTKIAGTLEVNKGGSFVYDLTGGADDPWAGGNSLKPVNVLEGGQIKVTNGSMEISALDNAGTITLAGSTTVTINSFTGNAIVAADGATLTDSTILGGTGYTSVEANGYNFVLSVNGDEAGTLNLEGENTLQNIEAGAGDKVNVTGALHFVSGSDGFKLGNGATWNINNAVIDGAWALSLDGAYMTDDENAPVSTMTFTDSTLTANQISAKGVKVGQEIGYGTFNVEFRNSTVTLDNRVQTQAQETADVNISFSEGTSVTAKDLLNDSTRGTITFNGTDEVNFSRVFRNKGTVKILNGAEVTANNTYDTTEHYSANEGTINVNGAALNLTGASTFANSGTIALENASFSAGAVDTAEGTFTVAGEDNTLNITDLTGTLLAKDGATLTDSTVGGTVEAQNNLSFTGNNYVKTLTAVNGGTITVEEGKTLELNNFSFGSSATAGNEYIINGGTITANNGFFQHGTYTLNANFETGYMYYSYGSDITVKGNFHSQGAGDGLDYVRGNLTIAEGGSSIHDAALWVGQPASWGEMAASLTVEGIVSVGGTLYVYNGSTMTVNGSGTVSAGTFNLTGTLTINAGDDFDGARKVVDVTGTAAEYDTEKITVNGAQLAIADDGDIFIHNADMSTFYVNADYSGEFGDEVAEDQYLGINAFNSFAAALDSKTAETATFVVNSDTDSALSGKTVTGTVVTGVEDGVTIADTANNTYVNMNNVEVGAGVTFNAKQFNFTGKNTIGGHIKSSSTFYNSGSAITLKGTADVVNVFNRYDASISVKGNAAAGQGAQAESQFKSGGYMGLYSGTFSVENSAAEFGYILMNQNNDASYSAAKLYLDNAALRVSGLPGGRNYGEIQMNGDAVIEAVNGSVIDIRGIDESGALKMSSGSITLTDSAMLLGIDGHYTNSINGSVTLNSSLLSSLGLINVGADGSITTSDSDAEDGINEITAVKIDNQGTISVGGTSTLNIGTLTGNSIELLDGAVIKDSTVGGKVSVEGAVTFTGDNTFENIADFGTAYTPNQKWSVAAGGSVTLTGKDKYGLGYGDNVTINGELENAREAYAAGLDADAADFSARGGVIAMTNSGYAGTTSYFTAENAYIRIGMDDLDMSFSNRVKTDGASGSYVFSFTNSVLEANSFNFQETEDLGNGNYTFNFTDSVLAAGPFNTNDKDSVFTFDNSIMTATYDSTNGGTLRFVNGSTADYSDLVLTNNGALFIADSTFTADEVSGSGSFTLGAGDIELNVGTLKQDIYANQNSTGAITLTGGIGATSNAVRIYGDAELSGFDVNADYTGKLVSGTGRVNVYGNTVIGDNTVMNLNAFQTTHSGVIEAGSVINTANFNAYDMGAADDGTVVDAKFVIEGTVNAVSFIVTNDLYSPNGKDELIVAKDGVVTATYMSGNGRFSLQTGAVTVYGYVYGDLFSGGGQSNIGSSGKRADGETYAMTVTVDGTYASEDSNNGKFVKVGSQKLVIYEGSALNVINGAVFSWENTVDNSGSITVTDSSFTAGTIVNSGTITVDALSTFTATDITRTGTITIDAANFAGGVKKIIDLTSTTSLEGSVEVINLGDNNVFYGADGDVFLTDSDRSTLYVGDAYAGYEFGTGVKGNVVGYNAYDYIADAVNSAMSDSTVGRVEVEEGNTALLYNWAVKGGAITTVNPNGLVIDLGNNGQSWHWGDIDMTTGNAPAADQPYSQISNSLADFTIGKNVTVIADALFCVGSGNFIVEGAVKVNAAFAQGHGLDISGELTVNDWLTLSANGTEDYLLVRKDGVLNAAKADIADGFDFTVDGTATLNYVEGEGTLNVGESGILNLADGDINAVVNESVVNVTGTDETEIAVSLFNNAGVLNAANGTLNAELINNGGVIDAQGGKIDAGCIQMQYGTWELGGFTASTEDREIEVSFIKEGDSFLDGITFKVTLKAGETSISGEAFKGIFSDKTANNYMTAGNYIVTAADKEYEYAVRGDMTIEQGSFKVTGKSELHIAEIYNGVIELHNGGEITDSSVEIGTVVVYGSDGKISGKTTINILYVGYPSGYAVEEAVSATITGSFTSTSNFVVGQFGTVNIGDAQGERTTVNAKSASWINNSAVNLVNTDLKVSNALSMTGQVVFDNSSAKIIWKGQMNAGGSDGKVTLKNGSSLEYTSYFYVGGYSQNQKAELDISTGSAFTGATVLTSTASVITVDAATFTAKTKLDLRGDLILTNGAVADIKNLSITADGAITADITSAVKFASLSNAGAITFDMTGAEGCILKVMDYTGTGSMDLDAYGNVNAGELYSSFRVYNNDLYAVTADFSEKNVTLSTPWAGSEVYEQVAAGCIYGVNAVGSLTELAADVEKLTITGSEGDLGEFTFTHSGVALEIVNNSDITADLTMTGADVTIAEGSTFTGTMTADESIKLSGTGTIKGTLSGDSGILTINDEITVDVIDGFTRITANAFEAGSISMTLGSDIFNVNGDLTVDGNIDFLTGFKDTMVIASGVTVEAAAINGSGNFTITMDYDGEAVISVSVNGAFETNSNLVINLTSFTADADGSSLLVSGIDAFAGSVVIGNAQLSLGDRIFNGSMLELAITEDGLAFVQAEGDFGVRGDVDNNGLSDILLFNTADNTLSALLPNADGFNMAEIGVLEGSNVAILGTGKVFGTDTEGQSIFYQADSTIKACVMNDGELTETRDIWQVADNGAEVIGLGDFNGDGATDLLVEVPQSADGGSAIGYITEGEWNYFQSLGSEWEVTHVGDFNGDGRDDVVLEHGAGFAGAWLIKEDGTPEWAGLDSIANVETCGVGDFNGDGIDDVLVRNGEWVGAWIIGTDGDASNGLVDSFIGIKGDLAVENTIEQIGDFNGDNIDDIVIRTAAGDLGVLSINGDSTDWKYYTTVSEDWKSSIASL